MALYSTFTEDNDETGPSRAIVFDFAYAVFQKELKVNVFYV